MNTFKLDWNGEQLKAKVLKVCEKNVRDSAERVASSARQNVSKDTEGLKNSIKVKTWSKKGACGAIIEAGEKGKEHIAGFVELGTPGDKWLSGKKKDKNRTPIKAAPYLRPALKKEKNRFKNRFKGKL